MVADRGLLAGDGDLPLPESVQGIVAARLDALPGDEKALLLDAAVIGKVFWLGAAASIGGLPRAAAEDALHRLERKEFVRRERRASVAGETEYAFRHLLVRDVAYGQIPRARRAEKHGLAAEWIETLGRPEDHAEMLAHHYLTALELSRAAGAPIDELAERARPILREAGDRAQSLGAYPAAKQFYGAALQVWPAEDQDRPQILFKYAYMVHRLDFASDPALLKEARDALLAAGDLDTAAVAEVQLAERVWLHGERDKAFESLDRAAALVEGRPTSHSKAQVLSNLSRYQMLAGEREAAIATGREALAMVEELGGNEDLRANVLNNIGSSRVFGGDVGGIAEIESSIQIALTVNSTESIRGYGNLASLMADLARLDRRQEMVALGAAEAKRFGVRDYAHWLAAEALWHPYWEGRWDEALAGLDELIADFEESRFWMEGPCRWLRGRILLARGDAAAARADAERTVDRARAGKDPQVLWPALALAARERAAVNPEQAREWTREVLQSWREQEYSAAGASEWLSDFVVALRAIGANGDLVDAAPEPPFLSPWLDAAVAFDAGDFAGAAQRYAGIGSLPDEAYARLCEAERLVRTGRRSEADSELQHALSFWRSVGATPYVREGEALLAAAG
jgi:hypothetical protein